MHYVDDDWYAINVTSCDKASWLFEETQLPFVKYLEIVSFNDSLKNLKKLD